MNKTYKEQYKEQTDLESGLAGKWGYDLVNTPIDLKQKKQVNNSMPVVANLTLRKFGKELEKTQKIKQVQDEIRALQNQRKLRELKQDKYEEPSIEQKSEIITLMEKIITSYNHIIEHKHLINKNQEEFPEEKVNIKQGENKEKKLLELVEEKKKLLSKADLSQQIKINKEIAEIYRNYQNGLDIISSVSLNSQRSASGEQTIANKSMKKYQSQTFQQLNDLASLNMDKFFSMKINNSDEKLTQMAQLYKNHSQIQGNVEAQMIKKFKDLQIKRYNKANRKLSTYFEKSLPLKNSKKNESIEKDLTSPFLEKKQVEEYRQMQNKIKSNSEALELWRNKISDVTQNTRLLKQKQYAEKMQEMKQAESNMQLRQVQLEQILDKSVKILNIQPTTSKNIFTKEIKQKEKRQQVEKQQIFAKLLRKKNNKFNKLWGTKILVKYNSEQQAKMMLKGEADKRPKSISRNSSSSTHREMSNDTLNPSKTIGKSQQLAPYTTRQQSKNESEEQINWRAEQKDEQHYWRMCKNQKINLLLKRR